MRESKAMQIFNNLLVLTEDYKFSYTEAKSLQKIARSLHNLYVQDCMYGLTIKQETRREKLFFADAQGIIRTRNLRHLTPDGTMRLDKIVVIQENRDPRGWPLIIAVGGIDDTCLVEYDRVCPL